MVMNINEQLKPHQKGRVISAKNNSDEAIAQAMQELTTQYGSVGTFIHLHPHLEFVKPNFAQHFETEKQILQSVFLLSKHLQKPLTDHSKNYRANFMTVSRLDGKLGLGQRGNVSVVGGGLTGLVKSLNLEWPNVFCRAVDIQPELFTEKIVDQIIAELHDANKTITEVGFHEEGRSTLSAQQTDYDSKDSFETKLTSDDVFLVSGGARGVTASCVIEMAKAFQCKFILLGRSDFDFEIPAFAKNEADENTLKRLIMEDLKSKGEKPSLPKVKSIFKNITAKKEIDETITAIKNAGGQAIYVQGDVTDISTIKLKLNSAVELLGKITGVIHGAGRLADKYIQDKTATDFNNVLSVKLDGLLTLLRSVNLNDLKHLVLFSSIAGFYGNVGQTDYSIANEILSKAAHLFKTNHPSTHVTSINWGAWDSGMVSPELKKKFKEAGVTLIDSDDGAAMMVNELNKDYADQSQVIIGGSLPTPPTKTGNQLNEYSIHRKLTLDENPF